MDIYFAGSYQQLLQLYILQLFVKDQISAEFRDIELQIFLGEDGRLALVSDYTHQFGVDLAVFSEEEGDEYEERVHDGTEFRMAM